VMYADHGTVERVHIYLLDSRPSGHLHIEGIDQAGACARTSCGMVAAITSPNVTKPVRSIWCSRDMWCANYAHHMTHGLGASGARCHRVDGKDGSHRSFKVRRTRSIQ
jgi:hypothetical protein